MNQNLMLENAVLIENIVLFVCVIALLLAIALVKRVIKLYQLECDWLSMQSQMLATDVFQQLQHFASHHLLNVRQLNGKPINLYHQPEKRKLIALYIIGASEYLGKQHGLEATERKVLAFSVLENEIKVSFDELSELYVEAKSFNEESSKHSIKMGARALGHWLKKGTSNQNLGLQALVS